MAEAGGLALEPIGNGRKSPDVDASAASKQEAEGTKKDQKRDAKPPSPISPEEYWRRKAAKYGWKQNTGNYARDHLANERTFLAWFRTAATFFSVGAVISKLTGVRNSVLSGVLLMALGGLVLLYGPYRYFTVKRLMDAGYFRPNFWGIILLVLLTAAAMITILVLSLVPTNTHVGG